MSSMPSSSTPTSVPYGFTKGVRTCRICGDEPVVATMTYPRGAPPYRQNIPLVQLAVETLANEVEAAAAVETKSSTSLSPVANPTATAGSSSPSEAGNRPIARPSRSGYYVKDLTRG